MAFSDAADAGDDSDKRGFLACGPGPGLALGLPLFDPVCLWADGGRPRGRLSPTDAPPVPPDSAAAAAAAAFSPVVP